MVDGSNALLYEPMVNFSAKFQCLATDKITFAVCASVRVSATSRNTAKTVRDVPMVRESIGGSHRRATEGPHFQAPRPSFPQTWADNP